MEHVETQAPHRWVERPRRSRGHRSPRKASTSAVGALVVLALLLAGAANASGDVQITDLPGEGELGAQGSVVVPTDVAETYRLATNFERWGDSLPDLKRNEVLSHTRDHAVVHYTSRIFIVPMELSFDLQPDEGFSFVMTKGRGLGEVKGSMRLDRVPGGTKATLTIHSRAKGLSRIPPDSVIRNRIHDKLESDLTALQRAANR